MSDWAIELQDVTFAYGANKRHGPWVLQGLHAKVRTGEVFVILGPNGRGKTTLLHLLLKTLQRSLELFTSGAGSGSCRNSSR